tara:strand:- start:799 stop:1875 length:1077 start_codon:yes stop_codon:yes gene_type:complete
VNKIFIISLKYSPGLLKEIICLKDCYKDQKYNPTLLLSKKYKKLFFSEYSKEKDETKFVEKITDFFSIFSQLKYSKVKSLLFYNSHPLNLVLFIAIKLINPSSKRVLVLHEPNKKNIFKNYGFHGFVVYLIIIFNKIQSWFCSDIIVLSPYGKELFTNSFGYNKFAKLHESRILLPKITHTEHKISKKYFSFIGNINSTKGIDWFLNLVSLAKKENSSINFALITGSKINPRILRELSMLKPKLKIVNPKVLYDEDISSWLTRSSAAFCLHKGITQSGVFVECMRHSVPVIALNEFGLKQFMNEDDIYIDNPLDSKRLLKAIDLIEHDHALNYVKETNKIFERDFCSSNFETLYKELI